MHTRGQRRCGDLTPSKKSVRFGAQCLCGLVVPDGHGVFLARKPTCLVSNCPETLNESDTWSPSSFHAWQRHANGRTPPFETFGSDSAWNAMSK